MLSKSDNKTFDPDKVFVNANDLGLQSDTYSDLSPDELNAMETDYIYSSILGDAHENSEIANVEQYLSYETPAEDYLLAEFSDQLSEFSEDEFKQLLVIFKSI